MDTVAKFSECYLLKELFAQSGERVEVTLHNLFDAVVAVADQWINEIFNTIPVSEIAAKKYTYGGEEVYRGSTLSQRDGRYSIPNEGVKFHALDLRKKYGPDFLTNGQIQFMTLECWEELIKVLLQFVNVEARCNELEMEFRNKTGKNKRRNNTQYAWMALHERQRQDQVTCGAMMNTIFAAVRSQSTTSSGSSSDARGSAQSSGY